MIVDERNDGGPMYAIPPGGTYDYAFPIDQRACSSFYHPHAHMLSGKQVNLGLAGAFILREDVEDVLGLSTERGTPIWRSSSDLGRDPVGPGRTADV